MLICDPVPWPADVSLAERSQQTAGTEQRPSGWSRTFSLPWQDRASSTSIKRRASGARLNLPGECTCHKCCHIQLGGALIYCHQPSCWGFRARAPGGQSVSTARFIQWLHHTVTLLWCKWIVRQSMLPICANSMVYSLSILLCMALKKPLILKSA